MRNASSGYTTRKGKPRSLAKESDFLEHFPCGDMVLNQHCVNDYGLHVPEAAFLSNKWQRPQFLSKLTSLRGCRNCRALNVQIALSVPDQLHGNSNIGGEVLAVW